MEPLHSWSVAGSSLKGKSAKTGGVVPFVIEQENTYNYKGEGVSRCMGHFGSSHFGLSSFGSRVSLHCPLVATECVAAEHQIHGFGMLTVILMRQLLCCVVADRRSRIALCCPPTHLYYHRDGNITVGTVTILPSFGPGANITITTVILPSRR